MVHRRLRERVRYIHTAKYLPDRMWPCYLYLLCPHLETIGGFTLHSPQGAMAKASPDYVPHLRTTYIPLAGANMENGTNTNTSTTAPVSRFRRPRHGAAHVKNCTVPFSRCGMLTQKNMVSTVTCVACHGRRHFPVGAFHMYSTVPPGSIQEGQHQSSVPLCTWKCTRCPAPSECCGRKDAYMSRQHRRSSSFRNSLLIQQKAKNQIE